MGSCQDQKVTPDVVTGMLNSLPTPRSYPDNLEDMDSSNKFEANKLEAIESRNQHNGDLKNDNSEIPKDFGDKPENYSKDAGGNSALPTTHAITHMFEDSVKAVTSDGSQEDVHNQCDKGGVSNIQQCINDALLSKAGQSRGVTHKTPTLDDFELPDLSESQLVTLEKKISYAIPVQQARAKVPAKYVQSPYTDLSDTIGTSENVPAIFQRKHPFDEYINSDVDRNLIDSF